MKKRSRKNKKSRLQVHGTVMLSLTDLLPAEKKAAEQPLGSPANSFSEEFRNSLGNYLQDKSQSLKKICVFYLVSECETALAQGAQSTMHHELLQSAHAILTGIL
ncbi:MAG TPA: hypothetical protein VK826_12445 [Bacteroidia bacterium]|nr:hypothetical protein [Bacteroidia bacterium]